MIKSAKNKWASKVQRTILNLTEEADSAAAIDGAHMSSSDREEMKRLGNKIAELLSKY